MAGDKKELIFYYKSGSDLYSKPAAEDEEPPTGENIDLEIILLGPKREQLKIRDKKYKRSSKFRDLFSFGRSRSDPDDKEDDYEDFEEDSKSRDGRSPAPKDTKTPVDEEPADDDDDDDKYQSAEESKQDDNGQSGVVKKGNERKLSRIPRIKSLPSSVASRRKPSKSPHRKKKSDLLDRLESMFNSTDSPAPGNSGSNVDYMDYF